ncbi:unnamed protein product [Brassica rapa subsp. trilocularis]
MKVEHQKVAMPEMTVLINNRRPAKESDFADHEETRAFTCWINGSQLESDSFFVQRGTPRYLIGSDPQGIPVEHCIAVISSADSPEAKKLDFCRLTARPERCSNSWRI